MLNHFEPAVDTKPLIHEGRLNYFEVLRRLEYWANHPTYARSMPAIKMLTAMLKRERDNLYFESRIKPTANEANL